MADTPGVPLITIVGNGAIGNLLALHCHNAQRPFQLLTRHAKPLTLHGVALDGAKTTFCPSVIGAHQPIAPGYVILPLKAYQIIPAIETLAPQLTAAHTVILLHNGMGTLSGAIKRLPDIPLVVATTSYGAMKPSEQHVKATGKGQTHAGWANLPTKVSSHQVAELLNQLLPPCTWHQDVQRPLWNKLAINAVINPLTAIHDIPNGMLKNDEFAPQIASLCDETAAIMGANGYHTGSQELQTACYQVINGTANNFSSMHQDVKHKRQTEIDFISGFLVAQGHRFNLSVSQHQAMLDTIKAMECL